MTEIVGPPELDALTPEDRKAYIDTTSQMAGFAKDHVVPIVVARPRHTRDRTSLRSASGVVVLVNSHHYLGTAYHVWELFLKKRAQGNDVIFQAGRSLIAPDRAGVACDPKRDLVFIPISASEARRTDRTICSTARSSPLPEQDSYVAFSGCLEELRDDTSDSHIGFGHYTALMRVTAAGDEHIVCQFEREIWQSDDRKAPPPGTDFSGMSGGPVFSLSDPLSMPLIGLISEFSPSLDILRIQTFANVRLP